MRGTRSLGTGLGARHQKGRDTKGAERGDNVPERVSAPPTPIPCHERRGVGQAASTPRRPPPWWPEVSLQGPVA